MARDALQWGNGASLTIAELSKRYNKPRANIQKIVDRAALEGWLLRAAGHKWTITLGITSEDDYAKFYRFRETIEPAAILEPDYCVNETELSALLSLQERLAAGDMKGINAYDLFEINTELHETIVSWSGNPFYLDALQRSNTSRRLIEYTKVMNSQRIDIFAKDHIKLLQSLSKSNFKLAAQLMRQHLNAARKIKTKAGIRKQ